MSVGFALLVFVVLGGIALVAPSGPIELGPVEIRLPQLREVLSSPERSNLDVEHRLSEVEQAMILKADSARAAREDTLNFYRQFFAHGEASILYPDSLAEYLHPVFRAMERADSSTVHVLHYGDSQIEGDRITHLLRDSLQGLFGGSGPGLLPLWQPIAARSVGQQLTDSVSTWYAGGMMGRRAGHPRYGCLASLSELRGEHVSLQVNARETAGFRRLRLYVGQCDSLRASCQGVTHNFASAGGLQAHSWRLSNERHAELALQGRAEVYGLEIDAGRGVAVSNIPLRGSDGLFFSRMEANLFTAMARDLGVRLVIMEFGGNALPMINDTASVRRYCEMLGQQIARVQRCLPEARILVIGPADMSVKIDGELQTHAMLPWLTAQMRSMCRQRGVAFWDMYAVMGGRNSMLAWAAHQPAWAATDYIHFTVRGARQIATVLWHALLLNYQYMKLLEEQGTGISDQGLAIRD